MFEELIKKLDNYEVRESLTLMDGEIKGSFSFKTSFIANPPQEIKPKENEDN